MKNLLSLLCVFFISLSAQAQKFKNEITPLSLPSNSAISTPTVVLDTLHYFYNKEYFKNPNALTNGLPYYKFPTHTPTVVSQVGSVFLNTDPGLVIYGLEGFMDVHSATVSSIPMTLVLYNVNSNLMPTSVIDSVQFNINPPANPLGTKYGGVFGSTLNPVSHVVPGNFAVLLRNRSTVTGDTVRVYRTNAKRPGHPGYNSNTSMGENLGSIRNNGMFYKTRNYNHPSFGINTDYEFCLAPMVTYTMHAGHITPPGVNSVPTQTLLNWQPLTFTNISTPHFSSRFFNLLEFYHHFYPYNNQPSCGFSSDSALSWHFDDEDIDYPDFRSPVILRNNRETITKFYDTAGCFTDCSMRATLRKMNAGGSCLSYKAAIPFSVCIALYVALQENNESTLNVVSENPVVNGKIKLLGPEGEYEFLLYNSLGELCLKQNNSGTITELNVSGLSRGCYLLSIKNKSYAQKPKTLKLVLE